MATHTQLSVFVYVAYTHVHIYMCSDGCECVCLWACVETGDGCYTLFVELEELTGAQNAAPPAGTSEAVPCPSHHPGAQLCWVTPRGY